MKDVLHGQTWMWAVFIVQEIGGFPPRPPFCPFPLADLEGIVRRVWIFAQESPFGAVAAGNVAALNNALAELQEAHVQESHNVLFVHVLIVIRLRGEEVRLAHTGGMDSDNALFDFGLWGELRRLLARVKLSPVESAGVGDETYDGNGADAYGEHNPGDRGRENEVVEMMIERGGKELVEEGVDGFCDDGYDEGERAATGYSDSKTLG